MDHSRLSIVILGPSISSWNDEQSTTYRGVMRELAARGHHLIFLEPDQSWCRWRQSSYDPASLSDGRMESYSGLVELRDRFAFEVGEADLVIVSSGGPEETAVGEWVTSVAGGVTAFYDFDLPATLSSLRHGNLVDLSYSLLTRYDLYLSFTGGPALEAMATRFGASMARPLYGSVDPEVFYPESVEVNWDLGYRSGGDEWGARFEELIAAPAIRPLRMAVAGPHDSHLVDRASNIELVTPAGPAEERAFYNAQRFAINLTRPSLMAAGSSPSVRLFEAAACSTPIISDWWPGVDTFFKPGEEILIARTPDEVLRYVQELSEEERMLIGERAWVRVLTRHTARHRAIELESYALAALKRERERREPGELHENYPNREYALLDSRVSRSLPDFRES